MVWMKILNIWQAHRQTTQATVKWWLWFKTYNYVLWFSSVSVSQWKCSLWISKEKVICISSKHIHCITSPIETTKPWISYSYEPPCNCGDWGCTTMRKQINSRYSDFHGTYIPIMGISIEAFKYTLICLASTPASSHFQRSIVSTMWYFLL